MDPITEFVAGLRPDPSTNIREGVVVAVLGSSVDVNIGDRIIRAYLPASVPTRVGASVRVIRRDNVSEVLSSSAAPGWTDMALGGSWVNFLGGTALAGYRRVGDMVHFRGQIKNGTLGATFFTMPDGYRPPLSVFFPVVAGPGGARLDVGWDGALVVRSYFSGGSNTFVTLNFSYAV